MTDRKIEKCDGYIVVTPANVGECIPIACPVCKFVMGTREDLATFNSWSCCTWCKDMFVRGAIAEARWHEGKRPTDEHVLTVLQALGMI